MRDVLCLILGGGRGPLLYPLTQHRSKAAVPFAGKYRFIDIPVSNCLNSGLNRIYVLTQVLSVSLHRHIANTYKFDPFSHGFVEALAAQQTNDAADWYRGTADAIRQNIRYVQEDGAGEILILPDDQLCRFDFRQLLHAHRDSRADVTIAALPVARAKASGFGILQVDTGGRVTEFVEKPRVEDQFERLRPPAGWLEQRGMAGDREYLGSMGIYLFRRQALFDLLDAQPAAKDLAVEIFPRSLRTHHFQSYLFTGAWEHLDTIGAYHAASLALAASHPPFDFHSSDGVIYTRTRNLPASRVSAARMEHCLVSDGCVVQSGTRMDRCVLGVRSLVGRDVTLRDAVLLGANNFETEAERAANRKRGVPDVGVGDGCVLERCIVDKNCRIGRGVRLVNADGRRHGDGDNYAIRDGIVVIPQETVVADGTVI